MCHARSIGKVNDEGLVGNREDTRYLAHDEPDGTIVLVPAVVLPARQARFIADPDRARLLNEGDRGELVEVDLDELAGPDR